jgi:putative tricarboxylic transport membrane protein
MDYFGIPSMPFIMTYILAGLFEENLRRGLINSSTGLAVFVTRPASAVFLLIGVAVVVIQTILPAIKRSKAKKAQ